MTVMMQDRELLDGFRRGDRSALTRVYDEYSRPIFAMLRRGFRFSSQGRQIQFQGMNEPWLLEDLVQETFARAFKEKSRLAYDGLRPYRNYLFTICRNLVADEYRKKTRRFGPVDENQLDAGGEDTHDMRQPPLETEQWVEDEQTRSVVQAFIDELDPQTRSIFDVRFIGGASVEESATKLKVSEYRIKRTEKVLRKQFFHYMQKKGYFEGFRYEDKQLQRALSMLLSIGAGIG